MKNNNDVRCPSTTQTRSRSSSRYFLLLAILAPILCAAGGLEIDEKKNASTATSCPQMHQGGDVDGREKGACEVLECDGDYDKHDPDFDKKLDSDDMESQEEVEETTKAYPGLNEFWVAGVNLAKEEDDGDRGDAAQASPPFELFEDFDIRHLIQGDEDWDTILWYRNRLERPSLSFYVDKVARKRWLPEQGFAQPHVYQLHYAHELLDNHHPANDYDQFKVATQVVQDILPADACYAAKPTHMSLQHGTWLVDGCLQQDEDTATTPFSIRGKSLTADEPFDADECASHLAHSLGQPPHEIESWALKNVKPGIVVEERWGAHDDMRDPPHEFSLYTIWGQVWVAQWNFVSVTGPGDTGRGCNAFLYRNGTAVPGHDYTNVGTTLPDWLPWSQLVEIAEALGAHKDMFRTDIFVGAPVAHSNNGVKLQVAVSECEIFPTSFFPYPELSNEGARLWIAGYEQGNYRLVPNTEVPAEFLATSELSASWQQKEQQEGNGDYDKHDPDFDKKLDSDDMESQEEVEETTKTNPGLNEFWVAGVNLAKEEDDGDRGDVAQASPPFELFEDFDIRHLIQGDEDWDTILGYRNRLERPSLSFYVDKVARKRWLPEQGFAQPHVYQLHYAHELLDNHHPANDYDQFKVATQVVQDILPADACYAAKPTHMSLQYGTWLVDGCLQQDEDTAITPFSVRGKSLTADEPFDADECASHLAHSLGQPPHEIESWALKNVKPGIVVEERWGAHDDMRHPPHEFNIFTIWGRVWVAQWNTVSVPGPGDAGRWCNAFLYRNGTAVPGHDFADVATTLPDSLPWSQLVAIAEALGDQKDMFRTDIFVGAPVAHSNNGVKLQVAVSECEIFPTTIFPDPELSNEGARLWIAGYEQGNYRLVPNTEVPAEFLATSELSASWRQKEQEQPAAS